MSVDGSNNGRDDDDPFFGSQFDEERFKKGQEADDVVRSVLNDAFDARNVTGFEGEEAFDNFAENKTIRQLMDYSGIDYLVDTFDSPVFGVNHRNHFNKNARWFDMRFETGTTAPSELDKIRKASAWDIVPKYASRLKIPDGNVKWFRLVDLKSFVEEIEKEENPLQPETVWNDPDPDSDVKALMYEYDKLRDRGLVIGEFSP